MFIFVKMVVDIKGEIKIKKVGFNPSAYYASHCVLGDFTNSYGVTLI